MLFPLRTDVPYRANPYMNWALIAANVVVFILQKSTRVEEYLTLDPGDPVLFSFIGYQFLHGDWLHLISNMLFLYIFGNNVNDKMGHVGYLGFYLAGGVAAGIGHMLTSFSPVIGASGAVAAVTGAYLALLPLSRVTVLYWFIFIGAIEIPSVFLIMVFFLKDVFYQFSAGATMVAHMAHISGTIFGFVICAILLAVRLLPRDHFDIAALLERWNRRRQYHDVVAGGYDPFTPAPKRGKRTAPDPTFDKIQDVRAQIAEAIAHQKLPEAAKLFMELRSIDPQQYLSRQSQLDIANQLTHEQRYPQAADAYEQYIAKYPTADNLAQIELMLGIIYSRYLKQYATAKKHLEIAARKLVGRQEHALATEELAKIELPAAGA